MRDHKLMGTEGPEAILPLKRGPGGYLGVSRRSIFDRIRSLFARQQVTADAVHTAIQRVLSESTHDDSLRAHEPAQPPVGTYGLLTGQHWD